jgi:hypothetical protein
MVVCDMNIDSRDAARIMVDLLPYCTPDADLVLTLKLSRRLGAFGLMDLRKQCSEILSTGGQSGFREMETSWLFSNSPNERTLVGTRRADDGGKSAAATANKGVSAGGVSNAFSGTGTQHLACAAIAVAVVLIAVVAMRRHQGS